MKMLLDFLFGTTSPPRRPVDLALVAGPAAAAAAAAAMGKNSNVNVGRKLVEFEMEREREIEEKRARKRANAEARLARSGAVPVQMDTDGALQVAAAVAEATKVRFGKVKVGKKSRFGKAGAKSASKPAQLRPSLTGGKRGIRKPSQLMKKTLKKMQKKREMELG